MSIVIILWYILLYVYRHEIETRLSHKPWKQEIAKIPDWPRRKAVAEFRLCVGHDCLGTHLHRTGIRPDPYCMLCSLREPMDRNHLGQCTALLNRLTPNDPYMGRNAPLTSKRCILHIYSKNIGTEYLNMLYTLRFFFLFKMQFVS